MDKRGVIFLLLVVSISFISASIVINEFDPNPLGADAGNEWVELYNTGSSPVDLTGYNLTNGDLEIIQFLIQEIFYEYFLYYLWGLNYFALILHQRNLVL